MVARDPLGKSFCHLVTANVSSSFGDGIARVSAPLLAARLTSDPILISGVAACSMLPWLLFAIPAGILLDRVDRRHAMAIANAVRTMLAILLFVLHASEFLNIWWLFFIIFSFGAFETIYDGGIRAIVPALVQPPDLPRANARITAGEIVVQRFLSGPAASALFALAVVIPLGITILSYAVAAAMAITIPSVACSCNRSRNYPKPPIAWYKQFADGYWHIIRDGMLKKLWIISIAIGLLHATATATLVLYLLNRLHLPEAWYGFFLLSGAAGAFAATAATGRLKEKYRSGPVMATSQLIAVSAWLLMGALPALGAVVVSYAISAAATTTWNILVISLRQAAVPSNMLGRVHGTWRTLLWGTAPIGALLGGLLAQFDLRLPFLVGGGIAIIISIIAFSFLSHLPNPEEIEDSSGQV